MQIRCMLSVTVLENRREKLVLISDTRCHFLLERNADTLHVVSYSTGKQTGEISSDF